MSTNFVYHGLGLPGYEYVHQKCSADGVEIRVRPGWRRIRCPNCLSRHVIHRGVSLRKLRTVPLGLKPIWLVVEVPRVYCSRCGCLRRINLGIADPRRRWTHAFANYVLALAKSMTLLDIARLLGVGWDCIKEIVKTNLKTRFSKPNIRDVRYIAIDEISVKKGHRYLTLVMDIERGNVIFVGDGKGSSSLEPFWEILSKTRAKILAVSMDMSPSYIASVLKNLPEVPIVFDHFHVVKLMNEALSQIRRKLYHEMDMMGKKVLKGSSWILLKNPDNLSPEFNEHERLQEALHLNEPLSIAYYMKEDLRQFWSQKDREHAAISVNSWIKRAEESGIGPLMRVGRTIAGLKFGILNWYEHRLSSGRMEGTNNKIKVLKRMAYGYRDMEFFKLRIMAIHQAKYALAG